MKTNRSINWLQIPHDNLPTFEELKLSENQERLLKNLAEIFEYPSNEDVQKIFSLFFIESFFEYIQITNSGIDYLKKEKLISDSYKRF